MWLYTRKDYGSRHCLQMMLKIFKKKAMNNKNKAFRELLANLSKAFVCWRDDLLIANYHANGLDFLSRA